MRLRKNLRIWSILLLCVCILTLCGFTIKETVDRAPEPPQVGGTVLPAEPSTEPLTEPSTQLQPAAPPVILHQRPDIYSGMVDDSVLADTAVIGNSCILGFKTYGLVKTADFYAQVGLNVQTAPAYIDPATGLPLVQAVHSKPYSRVILMFGENELGWPYPDQFILHYRSLIDSLKVGLPNAKYYIMGITPIGKAASEKGKNGTTMENATQFNQRLVQLAEATGAGYIDAWPVLLDQATGYLIEGASPDGVHLNLDYCKIWANYTIDTIGKKEALWQ